MDKWLEDKLNLYNFHFVRLVMHNERKGRYIAEVMDEDKQSLIVKLNTDNAAKYKDKLNQEVTFYQEHKGKGFLPELCRCDDGMLALKKLDVETLRYFLLEQKEIDSTFNDDFCKQLEIMLRGMLNMPLLVDTDQSFGEAAYRRVGSLTSGYPWDMKEMKRPWQNLLNRILLRLNKKKISQSFEKWNKVCNESSRQVHGDFHLNNILIDKNTKHLYVVDWENTAAGYPVVDIGYFYAQLMALLQHNKKACKSVAQTFNSAFENNAPELLEAFNEISRVYIGAVNLNFHFQRQPYNIFRWAWSYTCFMFIKK